MTMCKNVINTHKGKGIMFELSFSIIPIFPTHLRTLLLSMMPEGSPSGTLLRPDQRNFILSAVWKTLSMLKSHMGESKGKMWRSPSQFKTRWRLNKIRLWSRFVQLVEKSRIGEQ